MRDIITVNQLIIHTRKHRNLYRPLSMPVEKVE